MIITCLIFLILTISLCFICSRYFRDYKYQNQTHLTEQSTILITGGCLGIGHELIKQLFNKHKCTIINIDIRQEDFPTLTKEFSGNRWFNIHCDWSQPFDISLLLSSINVRLEQIDILINNAGIAFNLPLIASSPAKIIKTFQINLMSHVWLTKAVLDNKNQDKQLHIITMGSVMSHWPSKNSSDYVSTKWGWFGFHESWRQEYYHDSKVDFTIFCPYAVDTGMFPGFRNVIPVMFNIIKCETLVEDMIKSIALKEKVVYYPSYAGILCHLFFIFPTFLRDFAWNVICKIFKYWYF